MSDDEGWGDEVEQGEEEEVKTTKGKTTDDDDDDGWGDDDDGEKKGSGGAAKKSAKDEDDDDGFGDDDDDDKKKKGGRGEDDGGDNDDDDDDNDGDNDGDDGDDDAWGNDDFDDDNAMQDDDDQSRSFDIQIANLYYEAEDVVRSNPDGAFKLYEEVLERVKSARWEDLHDESRTAWFKSLLHITLLLYKRNDIERMLREYQLLLSNVTKVTLNEASDAVHRVLNAIGNSRDLAFLEKVYTLTSNVLETVSDTERIRFGVRVKLCRTYIEKADYALALGEVEKLHRSCLNADGTDDKKNKAAELIEVYALQIRVLTAKRDSVKLKEIYERTRDLTAAVKDPRSQSVIRESWGQLFANQGEWQRAYAEFYSAFVHYQDAASRTQAKRCLQCLVVANLLAGNEQNPFDASEAKVYQNDGDLAAIVQLRNSFEKNDVAAFTKHVGEFEQACRDADDTFLLSLLPALHRRFLLGCLLHLVRPYRRVQLSFLRAQTRASADELESLLVELLLNGEIEGAIDHVQQQLVISTSNASADQRTYALLSAWTNKVESLTRSIAKQVVQLHGAERADRAVV